MTKTEVILTILEQGSQITADLLYLFGTWNYREASRRAWLFFEGRHPKKLNWVESFENAQKFYSTLSHLRAQGFVSKQKIKGATSWKITGEGLQKVRKAREKASSAESLARFRDMSSDSTKIVTFDVPERDRKKRAWLRSTLASMGFSMLHKSVWMGRKKMPEEFFFELHCQKILRYVHVFAVTKSGTLSAVRLDT